MRFLVYTICIAAILFQIIAVCAFAEDPAETDAAPEPDADKKLLEEEKERFKAQALKERSVIRNLNQIDIELKRLTIELKALRQQEIGLKLSLEEAEEQWDQAVKDEELASQRAGTRLSALYKMYRGSGVSYLLSAATAMEFMRRYRTARHVVKQDVQLVGHYQGRLSATEERKQILEEQKKRIDVLKAKIRAKKREANFAKGKHRAVLGSIKNDQQLYELQVKELDQSAGRIQNSIDNLGETKTRVELSFEEIKGYLDPPVSGKVIGKFGKKVHSQFKTVIYNRGIGIHAPQGAPVRCVFDGNVRIVQDFLGYGRVVIVDHGNRYHTLYSHIDRPSVTAGASVRKGQIIGYVGTLASREETLLHFEIRHQGKALNPAEWLFLEHK